MTTPARAPGSLRTWSLVGRIAAVFSGLLFGIGAFMFAFFPAKLATQAEALTAQRAETVAQVMSTALGPALEFDDPDNAKAILHWLAGTEDARFGLVVAADGHRLASYQPATIPSAVTWPTQYRVMSHDGFLVVSTPIRALGGGQGMLHLGFSLDALAAQRAATQRAVGGVIAVVLVLGVLATMMLAALVVRPIRTLTRTAQRISRGELPPEMPTITGARELARLAAALRAMLERVNEVSQQELVAASRHAGMAEVATGVLHNVGNVLTAINVALQQAQDHVAAIPVERLRRLHELLAGAADGGGVIEGDRLIAVGRYAGVVADAVERERAESQRGLGVLGGHVEHVNRVISMQNAFARIRTVVEPARLAELLAEAVEIGCSARSHPGIEVVVDVAAACPAVVQIDRHRVLQILVNLITNARDAVNQHHAGGDAGAGAVRRIAVRATAVKGGIAIRVEDNGIGIAADQAGQIFGAGFTNKPKGHGYGLHSAALAARQMGGALVSQSAGVGAGATFTLTIPIEPTEPAHD